MDEPSDRDDDTIRDETDAPGGPGDEPDAPPSVATEDATDAADGVETGTMPIASSEPSTGAAGATDEADEMPGDAPPPDPATRVAGATEDPWPSVATHVPPPPSTNADERRSRTRRMFGVTLIVLGVLVLGVTGGAVGNWIAEEIDGTADERAATSIDAFEPDPDAEAADEAAAEDVEAATDGALTPREIYELTAPAVVHIDATTIETDRSFFGIPQERESEGSGSGFVIDDEGYIVTNAHVVEGAEEVQVGFGDALRVEAEVVGLDPSTDVAVVKVNPDELQQELVTVGFADSETVVVGDPVAAIGNPFSLDRTLTTGVVSAVARNIPSLNEFSISDVIQTDAAVNPGNSGGPLLNARGRVIGVNSQIQSAGGGFDGIAFAVPSNTVQDVVEELIADGEISYAWLGVEGLTVTPQIAEDLELDVDEGVQVCAVTPGGPADEAGLEGGQRRDGIAGCDGGDVITELDGEPLTEITALVAAVAERDPGDELEVTYYEGGIRERSATITLAERPDDLSAFVEGDQPAPRGR